MPAQRVNDIDSLQQMLPFHGQRPSPHHHDQNSWLIPLSEPPVGRNLLKRDLKRRAWPSLFSLPIHILGMYDVESLWEVWEKTRLSIVKSEMSNKFTIQIYSWILNVPRERMTVDGRKKLLCCGALAHIFLDWLRAPVAWFWLFLNTGYFKL